MTLEKLVGRPFPMYPCYKTITADNGREFADISPLETEDLSIFFAHPYSPGERGSK